MVARQKRSAPAQIGKQKRRSGHGNGYDGSLSKQAANSSAEDDSASEAGSQMSDIEAEFEFSAPEPDDHDGLCNLIRQLLPSSINASKLAQLITEQESFGSTIKVEDEDVGGNHVLALLTLIEITQLKECTDLFKYVSSQINHPKMALLINTRFLNVPRPLLVPLFNMLIDEIKTANPPYDFTYYIIIARAHMDDDGSKVFVLEENKLFANVAEKIKWVNDGDIYRAFMLVKKDEVSKIVSKLESL